MVLMTGLSVNFANTRITHECTYNEFLDIGNRACASKGQLTSDEKLCCSYQLQYWHCHRPSPVRSKISNSSACLQTHERSQLVFLCTSRFVATTVSTQNTILPQRTILGSKTFVGGGFFLVFFTGSQ